MRYFILEHTNPSLKIKIYCTKKNFRTLLAVIKHINFGFRSLSSLLRIPEFLTPLPKAINPGPFI